MGECIRCGRGETEERTYVLVKTESEIIERPGERHKIRITRETVTEILHVPICHSCARKQKLRAVLMTLPITLLVTPVLAIMSLFTVRGGRNIRQEVASLPTTLLFAAAVILICGLSVFIPIPTEMYKRDILQKQMGLDPNVLVVPLDRNCMTRKKTKPLTASSVRYHCHLKTALADQLVPLIEGTVDEAAAQALIGQTFTGETPAR